MNDPDERDPAEPPAFTAGALTAGDLDQAYVLIGLCHNTVSLDAWRSLVAAGGRPHPHVWQAIRDRRGYIHGLFAHRVEHDLLQGDVLVVTDIVTAGPGWRNALDSIVAAADDIACRSRCPGIRILVHPDRQNPGPSQLRAVFAAAGFSDRGPYLALSRPRPVA